MPQLSIQGFTRTLPTAAGKKRVADQKDDVSDSDDVKFTNKRRRTPLKKVDAANEQNKQRRVLDCVLIPADEDAKPAATISKTNAPISRRTSSTRGDDSRPRKRRAPQRPTDEQSSEDELLAASAKPKRKKRTQRKVTEESDFDADHQTESEDDFVDEMANVSSSDDSESVENLHEEDEASSAEDDAPESKKSTAKKSAGTGKNSSNGSAKRMTNLIATMKRLDGSLPPLDRIDDMFEDITTKAVPLGLEDMLKHLNGGEIRVATMCSGTESPMLALDMFRSTIKKRFDIDLAVQHIFSAEIVPYKQAYIERNFNPPVFFRDITEFTDVMNDEIPLATTVYGAKAPVPNDIHILIAGTSCVDFSKLNQHRKRLDEKGESARTFEGMLAFCKARRPLIVIIENVKLADWDGMLKLFKEIDYVTAGVHVDTKNYYLPQTRQRGYAVCFDKTRVEQFGLESPDEKWKSYMAEFRRPVSSPVSSFLLPTDRISVREQNHSDDSKREIDWTRCAEIHVRYRHDKRLGNARPFTHWQESGAVIVPEGGSPAWYQGQVERVWDLMDCSLLRKARFEMYDVRFKTRLWDVSQNVHMNEDSPPFGIAGCITPSGHIFISDAGRAATGEENLILQGIPLNKISLTTESAKQLQDLAGNAMSSTVVGSAIVSALLAGHKMIEKPAAPSEYSVPVEPSDPLKSLEPSPPSEPLEPSRDEQQPTPNINIATSSSRSVEIASEHRNPSVPQILDTVRKALRRCVCEGSSAMTKRDLQACVDCGHTSCIQCGGNPQHNYRYDQSLSNGRLSPQDAETEIRSQMPLQVKFGSAKGTVSSIKDKAQGMERYVKLVEQSLLEVFSLQEVLRRHSFLIVYSSPSGHRLELVLNDLSAEWRLFINPPRDLPARVNLREALQQPVAKATLSASLFEDTWTWRIPASRKISTQVEGHGGQVPTWWRRIELPDFKQHAQPRLLTVQVDDPQLSSLLNGTYRYLPRCGTACESLYKKIEGGGAPMFLFLDPTRVGDVQDDCFVFSTSIEHLDYGEVRSPIARFESSWSPWDHGEAESKVGLELDAEWIHPESITVHSVSTTLEIRQPDDYNNACQTLACQQAIELISCGEARASSGDDYRLISQDDQIFFDRNSWLFESMRRHVNGDIWHAFIMDGLDSRCYSCAPSKPALRWRISGKKDTIEPYEDSSTAAVYERAMKNRPKALAVEVGQGYANDDTSKVAEVRFGANLVSMAHRARARLPANAKDVSFRWRLRTEFNPSHTFSFPPFKLRQITGITPFPGITGLSVDLFPNQRRSLAWMLQQEAGNDFVVEELEEERLSKLGWALDMRAQLTVNVRGGICADHPGYGKTILSLALINSDNQASGLQQISARQESAAPGLIHSTATLVICPVSLVDQWMQEAQEKGNLKLGTDVIAVKTAADLDKKTIEQLARAKLVVVSTTFIRSDGYAERLAALAAVPGPATSKGRAFENWLDYATAELPAHLGILTRSDRGELKRSLKEKYTRNVSSENFQAVIPSRRLRGQAYMAAQAKGKSKPVVTKTAASTSLDTTTIGNPQLNMFYWNRVICDEYHQFDSRELAVVKSLKKDKTWGLSGTPAIGDFYDVSKNAALLGVPLPIGSDAYGIMKSKNIRELRKEFTSFELFDSMRQKPSSSTHSRIHDQHQQFLNRFVTRNVADFKIEFETHLVPVTLDLVHRVVYTEASQHFNSIEMRLKKGSKSKTTDREERLFDVTGSSETAEEALSKTAGFCERNGNTSGLDFLITRRQEETIECQENVRTAIRIAEKKECAVFASWRRGRLEHFLGDQEVLNIALQACSIDEKTTAAIVANATKEEKKDREEGLTSEVNALITRLLTSTRSLRFVKNVHRLQKSVLKGQTDSICANAGCKRPDANVDIGVSASCGHAVCESCYRQMKEDLDTHCPDEGCGASIKDHHLLWKSRMGDLRNKNATPYGGKLEATMKLLGEIRDKGDQAVLFVQYENQLGEVQRVLDDYGIASAVVQNSTKASDKVEDFKSANKTVIVLNASSETATGLNLQNANHVIFLSPLLRDQQYVYDATMAQAIGRVRRHGQKKKIHVYRIVALDTIDVDILEHRERRTDAICEYGASPITPPSPLKQGNIHPEPVIERTQLVREDGKFSLRPRSWLYCSGADTDEMELNKIRGGEGSDKLSSELRVKAKGRVMGWEDFSSLIKFSRAYTEDDD